MDVARTAMIRAVVTAVFVSILLLASPAWAQAPPPLPTTLEVQKTDRPTSVEVGELINYDIVVENTGTNSALDVVLTDVLPEGTVFESVIPGSGTTCTTPDDGENGTVTCRLGSVERGVANAEAVTITVRAVRGGVIENTASADGTNTEPAQDSARTPVGPNLEINKRDTPDPVDQEDLLAYTLTVVNEGGDAVGGTGDSQIVVFDQLPIDDVRVVAVRSRDFECTPVDPSTGRVRCTLDSDINPDEEASITILVDPEDAGTLENIAEVRFGRFLIDSDTETTRVVSRAADDGDSNGGDDNGDDDGDDSSASDTDDEDDVIKNTVPDKTLADTGGASGVAVMAGLLLVAGGSLLRASLRRER